MNTCMTLVTFLSVKSVAYSISQLPHCISTQLENMVLVFVVSHVMQDLTLPAND